MSGEKWAERVLRHDWTGVFHEKPPDREEYLVVTACHHGDNAFYEVGVVDHEVTARQLLDFIPKEPPHDCATAEICWMLDLHTPDGTSDDREITSGQASELLGEEVFDLLATGRANHGAWVEAPR